MDHHETSARSTQRRGSRPRGAIIGVLLSFALLATAFMPGIVAGQDEEGNADELAGAFTVGITSEDVPGNLRNGSSLVGRWRVTFSDDGTYDLTRLDIGSVVTGTYEIDGELVTFTDEAGLTSCSNPTIAANDGIDVSTGTYLWSIDTGRVTFEVQDDSCVARTILFATRPFTVFVPCDVQGGSGSAATPVVPTDDDEIETPTPSADDEDESDQSPLDILLGGGSGDGSENGDDDDSANLDVDVVGQELDDLLAQMSACWATGDPDRFLPLLSAAFGDAFLGPDDSQEAMDDLAVLMTVPISWERAGEADLVSDTEATVVVRISAGEEEEFIRYRFVREDGEWRWDGQEN